MDIVYTFRYDAKAWNQQLRYSLRSVEKHLKGVGNVFVFGFTPRLPGVIHVEQTDTFSAAKNIFFKILKAAQHRDVSADFMYIADDHFLNKDMDIHEYPYYVNGTLTELLSSQKMGYGQIIKNTIKALAPTGQDKNFNVHCPIIYNKARIIELSKTYDMNAPLGYLTKSLYMNTFAEWHKYSNIQEIKDCKIRTDMPVSDIMARIAGRDCWSTGHEHECPNIEKALQTLYPTPSKYE